MLLPWQLLTTAKAAAQQTTYADEYTGAMGGDTARDGKGIPVIPIPGDDEGPVIDQPIA